MPRKKTARRTSRTRRRRTVEEPAFEMSPKAKRELVAIIMTVLALLTTLSFFSVAGPAGRLLDSAVAGLFGFLKYAVPPLLVAAALFLAFPDRFPFRKSLGIGIGMLIVSICSLINLVRFTGQDGSLYIEDVGAAGGYIGLAISYPLNALIGFWGALIILIALVGVAIVVASSMSLLEIWELIGEKSPLRFGNRYEEGGGYEYDEEDETGEEDEAEEGEDEEEEIEPQIKDYDSLTIKPRKRRKQIPIPLDLLEHKHSKPTAGDVQGRMMTIRKTLDNFGIPVDMGEISVGPTVTQFTLKPAAGVKLSRIMALSNDLALSLAAHPIRIEAPIPGRSLVGIEVPNQSVAIVTLREVLESPEFAKRKSQLTVCLGRDVSGKAWIADLGKMPHMLVAGATGSGKTVCLNSIILSLIYQNSPDDLKLLLIDPKRVELPTYNGIPHLLTPAVTEVPKIINSLKWSIGEMERRFELLSKSRCRDIDGYNSRHEEKLPYIVIVVDELADLMVASAAEVEAAIIRLAQMARAVGIHLVIATQRPSVDVITGLIKANITTRIAFSVASSMDSRTILDSVGAEKLVGRGDSLLVTSELSKPKRIQCCFVADKDIKRVAHYLIEKMDEPTEYIDEVTERKSGSSYSSFSMDDDEDELYDEAKATVLKAGKASASYLQRRLKVGYARAARLLDLLEERGIIGPGDGAKPRQILVHAVEDVDGLHYSEPEEE
ncbi:MAG: DNA translocase FtsK 4TM domain-containing protein [Patescibacteria group bacterium]|nr:DNA translocase FtsK 4TM domain-containing protein [Patescibacteria group bacterium]